MTKLDLTKTGDPMAPLEPNYAGLSGIMRFVSDRGLGVALAVGLTFFVTWTVSQNLSTVIKNTQQIILDGERHSAINATLLEQVVKNHVAILGMLSEHEEQARVSERLLFAMCLNSAQDNEQRSRCTEQALNGSKR